MQENVQILTGRLQNEKEILTEAGKIVSFSDMNSRAQWAWLRFQMGQRDCDDQIRALRDEGLYKEKSVPKIWAKNASNYFNDGAQPLQFILKGSQIYTVASTRHLITPPEQVLSIAHRVMPDLKSEQGFTGVVKDLQTLPGLKAKFQLDAGDIFTFRAIGVGFAIRVIMCTNPLSFLGAGSLTGLLGDGANAMNQLYTKIERFKTSIELEERIKRAIIDVEPKLEKLKERVNDVKIERVTNSEAETILTAFPCAYDAGQDAVKQIKARFQKEDKTLWGMAQATSYVASHRDAKQASERLDRNLAAAGAAMIFIKNPSDVAERCQKWMVDVKKLDLEKWK